VGSSNPDGGGDTVAVMTAATLTGSAFGPMLREWRQRRRLTQLDLGNLADVSARHLSFLETGRSRPSREMVLHLSGELDVPLRGRNELMMAAGFAPAYTDHGLDHSETAEVRRSLQRILDGHRPYPAVLVDGMWNLVAANEAIGLLTDLVDPALLAPPVNVLRVSLHPRGLAPHVVDLEEYAAHLVSRLRRQAERAATTGLRGLLGELVGYCRDAGLDPTALPRDRIVLPLRLRHPDGPLTLFSTVAVLGAPLDVTLEEVAIESFFPADDTTADYLRRRFG
jgi:transcriptional regulator with XRE-family HTH domain